LRCDAVLRHHSCVRRLYHGDINFTQAIEAFIGLACAAAVRNETCSAISSRCQIAAERLAAKFEALLL
jgi:hypothetical protein